jgi:hypothetical protein
MTLLIVIPENEQDHIRQKGIIACNVRLFCVLMHTTTAWIRREFSLFQGFHLQYERC